MVLHRHELGPAVFLGRELHHGELVGPHGGCADVAHLAALDQVVERLHRFFDGDGGVKAVDLEEIEVVGLEALQRCVHGAEDRLP